MNIEIANRLVNLRKQNSLSQEALAEKLGISRQAVSKWERAEASPDTDNLILLSRIYGISMDELLRTEDEIPMPENAEMPEIEEAVPAPAGDGGPCSGDAAETAADGRTNTPEYVHIGLDGIHCKDKDSEVHVGWKGIHVVDTEDEVHVDSNGVYVNGEKYDGRYLWELARPEFPFAVLVIAAFIVIGVLTGAWHPAWVILLTIPLWHTCLEAFRKRDMMRFAFPLLTFLIFLLLGIFKGLWHPGWLVFLAIPVYYAVADYFRRLKKERTKEDNQGENYKEEDSSL